MAAAAGDLTFPEPWELPPDQYTWFRQARTEYSAAALTAQLLHWMIVLGFSPDTLARGARVVADEVAHARLSHELYTRCGGTREVPLDERLLRHSDDPDADMLWRTVSAVGGLAVEESVALPVFALRKRNATEPRFAEVIGQILRDEGVHRAFAWDVLDELAESVGVDDLRAWMRPRIAWWLRVYLLRAPRPHEPVYDARQLGRGLIDRREHWAVMRACVEEDVIPRFRKRGLLEDGVTGEALTAELQRVDGELVPPWASLRG